MPNAKGWSEESNRSRLEDLQWMDAGLENASGAARRLGITIEALEKWCARHGHVDIWGRLCAREPSMGNRNQYTVDA